MMLLCPLSCTPAKVGASFCRTDTLPLVFGLKHVLLLYVNASGFSTACSSFIGVVVEQTFCCSYLAGIACLVTDTFSTIVCVWNAVEAWRFHHF